MWLQLCGYVYILKCHGDCRGTGKDFSKLTHHSMCTEEAVDHETFGALLHSVAPWYNVHVKYTLPGFAVFAVHASTLLWNPWPYRIVCNFNEQGSKLYLHSHQWRGTFVWSDWKFGRSCQKQKKGRLPGDWPMTCMPCNWQCIGATKKKRLGERILAQMTYSLVVRLFEWWMN